MEILDPSILLARGFLDLEQADRVAIGVKVSVRQHNRSWEGTVQTVGIAADPESGNIPVLVRVENPEETLRCYTDVEIEFPASPPPPPRGEPAGRKLGRTWAR